MKRFLGLATLVLGLALSAGAQSGRAVMGGGAPGLTNGGGSGGSGGSAGGAGSGGASFSPLPSYPRTNFAATAISGTETDFVPSTFLPYESAVAAGQAALTAQHASVVQAASANSSAPKAKAKLTLIEDATGKAVIARSR